MARSYRMLFHVGGGYLIDENTGVDLYEFFFPETKWLAMTDWLTRHNANWFIEEFDISNIENWLSNGYMHVYITTESCPKQLMRFFTKGNSVNYRPHTNIDIDWLEFSDLQCNVYRNIIPETNISLENFLKYESFMSKQLSLNF